MKGVTTSSDLISEVEDQTLASLEYIKNFVPMRPEARIAPDYEDGKIIKSISGSVYPQVFAYIVQNLDREAAIQKLRQMGRESVTLFFSINPKNLEKKMKFPYVFKEIGAHSGERYRVKNRVKEKGVVKSCTIHKYRCVFCTETMRIEELDIPYCYPSVSFHQQYYNIRSLYLETIKPRLIYIDVVKTAEHDRDYCEYQITTLDGGS